MQECRTIGRVASARPITHPAPLQHVGAILLPHNPPRSNAPLLTDACEKHHQLLAHAHKPRAHAPHSPIDIANVLLRIVAHPRIIHFLNGQSTMHRRVPEPRKVRERDLQRRVGAAVVEAGQGGLDGCIAHARARARAV